MESLRTRDPLALVVQMGARRGYELARMLEARGSLARLHTSSAWADGDAPTWIFRKLSRASNGSLARRTVVGIHPDRVRATFFPELVGAALSRLKVHDETRFRVEDALLGVSARAAGLSGASVVLNTSGNGGIGFLEWAKKKGCLIATDIVITPRIYEIMKAEVQRWPGWGHDGIVEADAACYRAYIEKLVVVSDLLISPSDTVDDGLAAVRSYDARKLVRVPYGLGAAKVQKGRPEPRRVLFAGHAGLRKGLPYLAEAARVLKPAGYEIRIAGNVSPQISKLPECGSLTFLGHLGPLPMADELNKADIFCLPSLAEGMASVTLEALASALPCVVTRACGSPVRDGHDGIIVPERDATAIAEAIRSIAEDRILRERMSEAALHTALEHRLEVIGERLSEVLAIGAAGND